MAALIFPDAPSPGDNFESWQWDGAKWIANPPSETGEPLGIAAVFPGMPASGVQILIPTAFPVDIPANLAGSVGHCVVPPAVAASFSISTLSVPLGSASIATDGTVTFSGPGGSIAAGDALIVQAPIVQDTALATVGLTVLAIKA